MKIRSFLKLVEIQTKIASQYPFLFASLYVLYRFGHLDWISLGLFWGSLVLFDMTTTAINNYMDYRKSDDDHYKKEHNIIGMDQISLGLVRAVILVMLAAAVFLGILLSLRTGYVVLILGALSFFVGIFYTFGPIPISRMPLGEILSGGFMGFIILFLGVYIHQPEMVEVQLTGSHLLFLADWVEILYIAVISVPFVLAISNLMLANNICDLDQDIRHDRYLLPYYIGIDKALWVFRWSYYAIYGFIILSVVLNILPWTMLLILPMVILHYRLGRDFTACHIKEQTFILSVKGLNWISLGYIAALAAGWILKIFFQNR